ncbi:alcohol dehydrogenase family protein [Phenylobacterium aquaticum]|uniref:alcohol dehydrogenase family protein n=1 Tax=Phenylobacterium aquaticum TaxID=1763816 RepID=UPI0026EB8D26|nr:alcohol dehydrogenase family protein [Phenylobacterium aquaticum]
MKALLYQGARDIRFESFPDPELADDRDAIVRMSKCGICGSDLHIYQGHGFSADFGFCVGHEAVGEVVEVGRGVKQLKPGDKVMLSAAVGCGACASCLAGEINRCANHAASCYGLSHKLEGCQAEAIRVPAADFNVAKIPEGLTEDQALMLTDNLPTAWHGLRHADIRPGATVAVVGLGPIGLLAVEGAFVLGAARVFAIDLVPERRAIAASLGAIALDAKDAQAQIAEATHGEMCESVVEAVGADATIALSLKIAGRMGTVSVIGVNQSRSFDFPMGVSFMKNVTFRIGTCSVPRWWPELIPLIQAGKLKPERHITHEMPLSEGAEAYRMFDAREAGALKMVMTS